MAQQWVDKHLYMLVSRGSNCQFPWRRFEPPASGGQVLCSKLSLFQVEKWPVTGKEIGCYWFWFPGTRVGAFVAYWMKLGGATGLLLFLIDVCRIFPKEKNYMSVWSHGETRCFKRNTMADGKKLICLFRVVNSFLNLKTICHLLYFAVLLNKPSALLPSFYLHFSTIHIQNGPDINALYVLKNCVTMYCAK